MVTIPYVMDIVTIGRKYQPEERKQDSSENHDWRLSLLNLRACDMRSDFA